MNTSKKWSPWHKWLSTKLLKLKVFPPLSHRLAQWIDPLAATVRSAAKPQPNRNLSPPVEAKIEDEDEDDDEKGKILAEIGT